MKGGGVGYLKLIPRYIKKDRKSIQSMEFIKTGRKSEEIRHTFGAHKDGGGGVGAVFIPYSYKFL